MRAPRHTASATRSGHHSSMPQFTSAPHRRDQPSDPPNATTPDASTPNAGLQIGPPKRPIRQQPRDRQIDQRERVEQRARVLGAAERAELDDDAGTPPMSAVRACSPSW